MYMEAFAGVACREAGVHLGFEEKVSFCCGERLPHNVGVIRKYSDGMVQIVQGKSAIGWLTREVWWGVCWGRHWNLLAGPSG
jgi:hypothetical protein